MFTTEKCNSLSDKWNLAYSLHYSFSYQFTLAIVHHFQDLSLMQTENYKDQKMDSSAWLNNIFKG